MKNPNGNFYLRENTQNYHILIFLVFNKIQFKIKTMLKIANIKFKIKTTL